MPSVLTYLSDPAFTDARLQEAINIPPPQVGRLAKLGLFQDSPMATTYVRILIQDDDITIIPARERGGPTQKNIRGARSTALVDIPHFPLDDAITPMDLQNIVGFGNESFSFVQLTEVINQKLSMMRAKHDATQAHLDWGALNGIVLDAEGKTLLNLWTTFGITQTSTSFVLGTTTTDIAAKNRTVKQLIRTALRGFPASEYRVFAGATFYDSYVNHANVKASLAAYQGPTANPARDNVEDTFSFAGITMERVDETFPYRNPDNTFTTRRPIPLTEALMVPLGTPFFKRYAAPPDSIFEANTQPRITDKVFVSTTDLPHGKGREIHTESNLLPICLRPDLIQRLTVA